jgi:cell division protein FtsZ
MTQGGVSVISVGESRGHGRVDDVVEDTLKNSLLDVDYTGARGTLIQITGGPDLTLGEANEIGEKITEAIDPAATVIWGARIMPEYEGKIEVIAIMTGVKSQHVRGPMGDALSAPKKELDMNLGINYLR